MIPKIIHYCWMSGDTFPELIKDCLNSWQKNLSDYKIIEWNSDNFDYNKIAYTKEAMQKKKYAFVSDYVRLYVLYKYGGIYLDSDIKVLKSFNDLLDNKAFTGFESNQRMGVWLLASEKNNPIFKEMLECYTNRHFVDDFGNMDLTPNPVILSPIFQRHGIEFNNKYQKKELITIYPTEYFCPLNGSTGELNLTNNSYAIHLFNGAWREKSDVEFSYYYKKFYLYCPGLFPYFFRDKLSKSYASYKIGGCNLFYSKLKKYLAKQYK